MKTVKVFDQYKLNQLFHFDELKKNNWRGKCLKEEFSKLEDLKRIVFFQQFFTRTGAICIRHLVISDNSH